MKLFIGILIAAAILGGFAGGELFDTSFPITGMIIGSVGTGAIILGLGAYFSAQDDKKEDIPDEMKAVFGRMITGKNNPTRSEIEKAKSSYRKIIDKPSSKANAQQKAKELNRKVIARGFPTRVDLQQARDLHSDITGKSPLDTKYKYNKKNSPLNIENVMKDLMEQDLEIIKRGETPEARLVPHHAIKRDIIIKAYTKDFDTVQRQVSSMAWSEKEIQNKRDEIKKDFAKQIYGIKRLSWKELDKIISLMKETRTDFSEIEEVILDESPTYARKMYEEK